MILTVEEVKGLDPEIGLTDAQLALYLEGIEQAVKGATNNDFERYRDQHGEIAWPADIKMGALNLLRWDADNRDRVGVASETISRHSVTYSDVSGTETEGGYPVGLMRFLDPYRRARF